MHVIGTRTSGDGMLASSARSMPGFCPGSPRPKSSRELESLAVELLLADVRIAHCGEVYARPVPSRNDDRASFAARGSHAEAALRQRHAMYARPRGYQIWQTSVRTIGSPALHENAAAKEARFDGAPIARNCGSGCGFVFIRSFANSGRTLAPQTRAHPR